jgi:hypothetical protein
MRKIKVDSCVGISKINNHLEVKDKILSLIDSSEDSGCYQVGSSTKTDGYVISKYDYPQGDTFERQWVKEIKPYLLPVLSDMINDLGYQGVDVKQIWYQQYLKGSAHSWHVHGGNFTGVYYLEYPEGSPPTEIISPYDSGVVKMDMVSEGDVIIFPACWIHRGPINEGCRKTIVSYNLNIHLPYPDEFKR